jgi:hypothetical protein
MTVLGRTASTVSGNLFVTVGIGLAACALVGGVGGTLLRRRASRGSVAAIGARFGRLADPEPDCAEELPLAA